MSLDLDDPDLARVHDALAPYLRDRLRAAADHALRIHADELCAEHLFWVLMEETPQNLGMREMYPLALVPAGVGAALMVLSRVLRRSA